MITFSSLDHPPCPPHPRRGSPQCPACTIAQGLYTSSTIPDPAHQSRIRGAPPSAHELPVPMSWSARPVAHSTPGSTRRVLAPELKLPGEAQPMSVRRCTYHHRHTPSLAAPSGVQGTARRPAKAENQLQSESLHHPPPLTPTPPQTRHRRSPWAPHKAPESMSWGARPGRHSTRTLLSHFFIPGKKCENPFLQATPQKLAEQLQSLKCCPPRRCAPHFAPKFTPEE